MNNVESADITSPVDPANLNLAIQSLRNGIAEVIRGKNQVITDFLTAVIAGGSVLLEDLPGVGKTTLCKTFAQLVNLRFDRLQCTPDLLPADVIGFSIYNAQEGSFTFRPGPIFCNLLLVDEINRASPRTQSALLEAMAEHQVTIEGSSRSLASPFLVVATQNPVGFQGTYPLPEAQLDRFLFLMSVEYPDHASELELLYRTASNQSSVKPPIVDAPVLLQIQQQVQGVEVHRDVADYMVRIVTATRNDDRLQIGCSPRGSQMLFRASQAAAFISGRKYVLPDDVQHVAPLALAHRIVAKRSTHDRHTTKRSIVHDILEKIQVPA